MSYARPRVADYESARDADHCCNGQGIDRSDCDIKPNGAGVTLYVRGTAMVGHEHDPTRNGFF